MKIIERMFVPFVFNPADPAFVEDPYPTYRRMRDEHPLYYLEEEGLWVVSRHADVDKVLSDFDSFSSSKGNVVRDLPMRTGKTIGSIDPPQHDVLRRTLNRGFTPKRIAAALDPLRTHAREIISAHADRREWDFVSDFSRPLLYAAIGRMLGFDDASARIASDLIGDVFDGEDGVMGVFMRPERMAAIFSFLNEQFQQRKAMHGKTTADVGEDLFTFMLDQRAAGADLSDEQIVWNMSIVLLAGNASIGHFAPNLILALWQWPDARRDLREDFGRVGAAIDEGVRYDTSTQAFGRQTTREVNIAGGTVPAGQRIIILNGSANRDERVIADPDMFILGRRVRHFGFGAGPHTCMGAHTTKRLLGVLLEELLPVVSDYELNLSEAVRVVHIMSRGLKSLPMRW